MEAIEWETFKSFVDQRNLSIQWLDLTNKYWLKASDNNFILECILDKDSLDTAQIDDFEQNYKSNGNKSPTISVVTLMEKNDKTLRSFCAFAETDFNGEAEFCIPVPSDGRWVAYGDIEFEVRHFGDYVKAIEVTDLDRKIALQIAQAQDPKATEPVADEVVRSLGYPLYPILGHYDEREFPESPPANSKGTFMGGMTMTFQYDTTEAQPVGGFAWVPGFLYFRVIAKKAVTEAGHKCQMSVDWAQNG